MRIIDCSACVGLATVNRTIVNHENYPVVEEVRQAAHGEDLLRDMDFCGVEASYVYHQAMYDTDPVYGNARVLEETAKAPERLRPTWALLPPVTEEEFAPERLFPAMKEYGVAALRAFPQRNRFRMDRVTLGELLDGLCERNIPLYLSPMDGWDYIFDLLRDFPKLTVILTNYGLWGSDRYFYPLARAYENLYIDTSDYQMLGGLKAFVDRFGPGRLLFGSNAPMDNIGGPLATLLGSGLAVEAIEAVAHGNIEALMGRVRLC